jgi:hypothetical protein
MTGMGIRPDRRSGAHAMLRLALLRQPDGLLEGFGVLPKKLERDRGQGRRDRESEHLQTS